jgi:5-methylcytosine-specific restriction enzyme subunit McrC
VLNRKSEKYDKALKIAKMLILNYSPDISKGQENMLALLFDMNDLWEKYIYTMLKRTENSNCSVKYHRRKMFWNKRYTEPDILVTRNKVNYIIDTKWKIVSSTKPLLEDLKQMYVYNMCWDAPKSMLLYPLNENKMDSPYGVFHKGRETENLCKLGFVSVLNEAKDNLNLEIGKEIINKL